MAAGGTPPDRLPWERERSAGGAGASTPGRGLPASGPGPLPTVVAVAALLVSVGLTALRLVLPDLLPPAAVAVAGYVLTPWAVMAAYVPVQLAVLRGDDADPDRPDAAEGALRRLHVLAVLSLVTAVPHVIVLAQLFELWRSGR